MTKMTKSKKNNSMQVIEIQAETIYMADSLLREEALKVRMYPSGVSKTEKQGIYLGYMY